MTLPRTRTISASSTSSADLETAVTADLQRRGVLRDMMSALRKHVVDALQSPTSSAAPHARSENALPHAVPAAPETMLVNALIREYLEYNGYALTQTVMEHEAPTAAVDRRQMEAALGVATESSDAASFPLLYSLVFQHVATERPLALNGPTTVEDAPAANEKTAPGVNEHV